LLGALFETIDAYLLLVWAHFLGFWFITQVHNGGNPSELLLVSEKYTQKLELENKQSLPLSLETLGSFSVAIVAP
jgi:hypothetical protein